jgi:hypothetical protein
MKICLTLIFFNCGTRARFAAGILV